MNLALVFDDGFRRSCEQIATLFEQYGLPAIFAVVAQPPPHMVSAAGDWTLWNELAMRGHRIDPHGLDHANESEFAPPIAQERITRCLEIFGENLEGFERQRAVFHFPYNASTAALSRWTCTQVAAVRVAGSGENTETDLASRIVHCAGFGPEACDDFVLTRFAEARRAPPAALVLCLHGVDEGWGPVRLDTLRRLLDEVRNDPRIGYWPMTFPVPNAQP